MLVTGLTIEFVIVYVAEAVPALLIKALEAGFVFASGYAIRTGNGKGPLKKISKDVNN